MVYLIGLFESGRFTHLLYILCVSTKAYKSVRKNSDCRPGPEFILKLKIKRNDWLLADTCP